MAGAFVFLVFTGESGRHPAFEGIETLIMPPYVSWITLSGCCPAFEGIETGSG